MSFLERIYNNSLVALQNIFYRYRRYHGVNFDTWCGMFGERSIIYIKNQSDPYWIFNNSRETGYIQCDPIVCVLRLSME
jgi:hypothetical protein